MEPDSQSFGNNPGNPENADWKHLRQELGGWEGL